MVGACSSTCRILRQRVPEHSGICGGRNHRNLFLGYGQKEFLRPDHGSCEGSALGDRILFYRHVCRRVWSAQCRSDGRPCRCHTGCGRSGAFRRNDGDGLYSRSDLFDHE
ncbi:hypothetical protein D3C81_1652230 [compost metagenome]